MRLISWSPARTWSSWHIAHLGEPLCGVRIPDKPMARAEKPAQPSDWARTCETCREIALRSATPEVADEQEPEPAKPPLEVIR